MIENKSITSSLKTILNNFSIQDLYINEPPIDEIIGKILIKKDYDIKLISRKIFTLLKVQYSNMLEYRIEIALWAISGIIPFFMLNIWTTNNLNESLNISDILLSIFFMCFFCQTVFCSLGCI